MAAVVEYVIGALTAVSTSLVVVVLLWRLSRLRANPRPPCCDVTDLLGWLLDAWHAVMGAAILVLVLSDGVTCTVPGFLALLAAAQTLCLLATRAVVTTTGHVMGSRDAGKVEDDERGRCWRGGGWCVALVMSVVTVFCALPLSQLPIATSTTARRNETTTTTVSQHLHCLPLTWTRHSADDGGTAAWPYSCFVLVAVCWLPLLVAVLSQLIARCRHQSPLVSAVVSVVSLLTLVEWTVVVLAASVQLFAARDRDHVTMGSVLAVMVDVETLTHVIHTVLVHTPHCRTTSSSQQQRDQLELQLPPARLTAVNRPQSQLVSTSTHLN